MQRLHTDTPGSLQLRQPQRYSDRHPVPGSGTGKYQSRGQRSAQPGDAQENSTQPAGSTRDGKNKDGQRIKS